MFDTIKTGPTCESEIFAACGQQRFQEIGLIEGTQVECLQKSPAGDPVAYLIRGAVIALRAEDSATVLVY